MLAPVIAALGLALAQGPGVEVQSLPFDPAALRARGRVERMVKEQGREVVYAGVPLRVVLEGSLKDKGSMAELRALADAVVLVRAADGYQAAVSAAAVAMDEKGERFLLALARDGRPLGEGQGPVRLVVAGDPQRVRWVRGVVAIDLVRLPRSKAGVKAARPASR